MKELSLNYATEIFVKHYGEQIKLSMSNVVYGWITHKIRHSYAVLHAAQNIIAKDVFLREQSRTLIKRMEIAALLHDIGRFTQHDGDRILTHSEFEHGNIGMQILLKEGYNDPAILLGTKYHNKYSIDELYNEPLYVNSNIEDKSFIEIVVKLVRDADKLQNLEYCIFDRGNYFFAVGNGLDEDNKNHVKEAVIEQFIQKVPISNSIVNTNAEKYINLWSWKFDLHFKGTSDILNSYEFDSFINAMLKKIGVDEEVIIRLNC